MFEFLSSVFVTLDDEENDENVQVGLSEQDKLLSFNIFYAMIGFSCLVYVWEQYLEFRERRVVKATKDVPSPLRGSLDEETLAKSCSYYLDRSGFGLIKDFIMEALHLAALLYYFLPWIWLQSGGLCEKLQDKVEYFRTEDLLWLEIQQSIVLIFLIMLISTVVELPFSIYSTFVIEERHGFNKQTAWFFIKDKIKGLLVFSVLIPPILSGILYIIGRGGDFFVFYVFAFCFVVSTFMMFIYPTVIAPIFDKYTPLPEGELRTKIEDLAASIEFPLTQLYVVEGSKRSGHSNAYFYGFFKSKRIVLYDTLLAEYTPENKTGDYSAQAPFMGPQVTTLLRPLSTRESTDETSPGKVPGSGDYSAQAPFMGPQVTTLLKPLSWALRWLRLLVLRQDPSTVGGSDEVKENKADGKEQKKKGCTNDEVVAVLAHELGHWNYNHVLKGFIFGQVNLFLKFLVFSYLHQNPLVFHAFGFPVSTSPSVEVSPNDTVPIIISLTIIFSYVFNVYNEACGIFMTVMSRRFEFQADAFAHSLGKSALLKTSLVKLHTDNLSVPVHDWLNSAWHHSHPPLLERIAALDDLDKKKTD
ncbi:unnamed protein product [Cyprideis torosa]|uniref:Ste24 endopeptidase n=1 Tax=Cyprideis torosa TaxID=163714 RepID=A0A7R8ZJL8_9CRUS|nr:unnamed protein product [Cyprideis torosa]CAG0882585.1 unnamed protein product [Cyprideis torosa]